MQDPVTLIADGENYERTVLELWILGLPDHDDDSHWRGRKYSPLSGAEITTDVPHCYFPNDILRRKIRASENPSVHVNELTRTSTEGSYDVEFGTPRGEENGIHVDVFDEEEPQDLLNGFMHSIANVVTSARKFVQTQRPFLILPAVTLTTTT